MEKSLDSDASKIKKAKSLAALKKALEAQESIRERIGGNMDILKVLERSRESHP